jgi:transketolase
VHGAPLGKDEVAAHQEGRLGMPAEDFFVGPEAKAAFAAAAARNEQLRQQWHAGLKGVGAAER